MEDKSISQENECIVNDIINSLGDKSIKIKEIEDGIIVDDKYIVSHISHREILLENLQDETDTISIERKEDTNFIDCLLNGRLVSYYIPDGVMYIETEDDMGWTELRSDSHYADIAYSYLGDTKEVRDFIMKIAKARNNRR